MLLAIDVGNTHTGLGLFADAELVRHWRISTLRERTTDEYRLLLGGFFASEGLHPRGAAIASVVPPATTALRPAVESVVSGPVLEVGPGIKTGMPILIDNPREVGADRVVNSIAAQETYGAPVVVVDFGTATTFDVIGAEGEYLGGVIAPGVEVSMDALVAATAALRRVELQPPASVVGKSTVEAIQSGLLYGYAALVDGIVDRILGELGRESVATVATGGLASTIVPLTRTVSAVDDFLTLTGLRLVYERNHPQAG